MYVSLKSSDRFTPNIRLVGKRRVSKDVFYSSPKATLGVLAESDHGAFIKAVADIEPPALLPYLLKVLEAKGEEVCAPREREGIVPLAIPLSRDASSGEMTALLRWPTAPSSLPMPVVRVYPTGVRLLAKSVEEFIARALAEEDIAGGPGKLSEAAGIIGAQLYTAGSFANSGIARKDIFLMKKVGLFPDVFENLALGHLERGDQVSALVAGEFYSSRQHFPGFGRPYVFNMELLSRVGREAEAKDAARIALKSPWWTLGTAYQEVAKTAGFGDAMLEYALERLSDEGRKNDLVKGKDPAQVSLDQAAFLLDVASVEGDWEKHRERLAALYEEGGLHQMALFVLS